MLKLLFPVFENFGSLLANRAEACCLLLIDGVLGFQAIRLSNGIANLDTKVHYMSYNK